MSRIERKVLQSCLNAVTVVLDLQQLVASLLDGDVNLRGTWDNLSVAATSQEDLPVAQQTSGLPRDCGLTCIKAILHHLLQG